MEAKYILVYKAAIPNLIGGTAVRLTPIKQIALIAILLAVLHTTVLLASCASPKIEGATLERPLWYPMAQALYTSDIYLCPSLPSSAASAQGARDKAIQALAAYVATTVEASSLYKVDQELLSVDGSTQYNKEYISAKETVHLTVKQDLYALETTEPYYDKDTKLYYDVAFIQRSKAYAAIEPTLREDYSLFSSLYTKAIADANPFYTIRYLEQSLIAARKLKKDLAYAALFDSESVTKDYGEKLKEVAAIPKVLLEVKHSNPICVSVIGDYKDTIKASIESSYSSLGFIIASSAPWTIRAAVELPIVKEELNLSEGEDSRLTLYSISGTLSSDIVLAPSGDKESSLWSYRVTYDMAKFASYNLSKVSSKAIGALEKELRLKLPLAFKDFMAADSKEP